MPLGFSGLLLSDGTDRAPDLRAEASSEAPAPFQSGRFELALTHAARRPLEGTGAWRPDPDVPGDAWLRVDLACTRGLPPGRPAVDWTWQGTEPRGWQEEWSPDTACWWEAWRPGARWVRVRVPEAAVAGAALRAVAVRWAETPTVPPAPAVTAEATRRGVTLDWPDPGDAGVLCWQVVRESGDARAVFRTGTPPFEDRSPTREAGQVTYRVRAELADGRTGPASAPRVVEPRRPPSPFPASGVVEGYYGPPWSWRARRAVVGALGASGLDTYVWAPKQAPSHRDRWREPHDEAEQAELAALCATARSAGVRVLYGIAPGLDEDCGSAAALGALEAKCRQGLEAGAAGVVLLFDDLPTSDVATLAEGHARIAAELARRLGAGAPLWVVPLVYYGPPDRLQGPRRAHLEALAALPPDVPVAWTGSGVFSDTLGPGELRAVSVLTRHPVWVWDNYPVNDAFLAGRLFLGPLRGREAGLPAAVAAWLANPGPAAHASAAVVLTSVAEYVADPEAYDPDAVGPLLPEPLAPLEGELQGHGLLWGAEARDALEERLAVWQTAGKPRSGGEAVALARHLAQLWRLPAAADRAALTGGLHAELMPFVRAAAALGAGGLRALCAALAGEVPGGGGFFKVAGRVADTLESQLGGAPETVTTPRWAGPAESPVAGAPWRWEPAVAVPGGRWWAEGPPGLEVDPARGRLSWTPAGPGPERIVVGVDEPDGVSAALLALTVRAG